MVGKIGPGLVGKCEPQLALVARIRFLFDEDFGDERCSVFALGWPGDGDVF